ncbi:MAG TPA: META domain-containing protein [Acidimicrobiales bacterium]|nr:META domain-containing protein [Acidimicrobiales bacterium]
MTSPLASSLDRRRRLVGWCLVPLAAVVFAGCGSDDDGGAIPQSGERETTTTEATTTTTATDEAAAEAESPETTAAEGDAAEAPTGEWTMVSLTTGAEVTEAPTDATLTFSDGRVEVATGCNTGFGTAEVGDGTIVVGTVGLTMMACPDDVMAWETELAAFLEGELTYEASDGGLVLARGDTELTLESAG